MTSLVGVAISTTGDEHRLGFLETTVAAWREHAPLGSVMVVTVDGDEDATARVREVVDAAGPRGHVGGNTVRVGQPLDDREVRDGRLGVATNKNTGIEYLMDAGVQHLFLCDDDTRPLSREAWRTHTDWRYPHSMVCWGRGRRLPTSTDYAKWSWPRGVLLYARREVIEAVGGMDERFGPGGHEHVEWSRRIHQAGLTPTPFLSPLVYGGQGARGAAALWSCEDMPKPGEWTAAVSRRREKITSVRRRPGDWEKIEKLMGERDGNTAFVPFRASENQRASATLSTN